MKQGIFLYILLIGFGMFGVQEIKAQLTAADNCSNATPITVASTCNSVTYTNIGATNSGSPTPTCGNFQGADVWFQIIVPVSGHLQIKILSVSGMIPCWSVYTGSCGSLTELRCNANYSFFNLNDTSKAGQTIFVRVWRQSNATGGNFSICAWETSPPLNDFCVNAISLSVDTNCNMINYNNIGCSAEPTAIAASPLCGGYQGGDVWFKTVVPSSGHLRIEKTNVSGINAQSAIYTGSCGAFTQLACLGTNDPFNLNNPNLAGQTIYIRVWHLNNAFDGGTFSLCAWEPNTPANDSCAYAIPLVVGSTCLSSTYNNIGCTAEPVSTAPNPTCSFYSGGDVWFRLTVPASGHLRIEKANISGINAQFALYTGSCGNMTQYQCANGLNAMNIHDHNLGGQEVYIRVWNYAEAYNGGVFSLCVFETNPPENDFCSNAILINVNSSCNYSNFNNLHCTADPTSTVANPSCSLYNGGDVWFKTTVPASGHLRIERSNVNPMSAMISLYSGTCGAFTSLGCSQSGSLNLHNHAMAGQTVYIRVWNYGDGVNGGSFNLCAWEPNTAENDFCANAVTLPVSSSCVMQTIDNTGCTAEAVGVSPNPTCGFFSGGDIWFKFTMPASGHVRIEKLNSAGVNIQYALYTGNCGAMVQFQCAQNLNSINIHNHALAGQVFYLRMWNFNQANEGGTFDLCVWEPNIPENDFCMNAIPLTVGFTCNPVTINAVGCTSEATSVAAAPSCGFYAGGDIWYTFTMPLTGLLNIEKSSVVPMNAQFALYTGTCGAFTQIACSQLQNSFTLNNNFLAGQTIYLRIWNYNNSDPGTFTICLYDPTCLVDITSITSVSPSCSLNSDGSLTVNATCTLCVGSLEYSINNGPYQSNPTFNNLLQSNYTIRARDSGKPLCIDQLPAPVFLQATLQAFTYYEDIDGDQFGKPTVQVTTCYTPPANYVSASGDCNDSNPLIHPGAIEIPCNNVDENCNGLFDDKPVEMNVLSNCNSILDENLSASTIDSTDFGDVRVLTSYPRIFTIENHGISNLVIGSVNLYGTDATSFSIDSLPTGTIISPNQSVDLQIVFTPMSAGVKHATVSILNNDCDETVYNFAIKGKGTNSVYSKLELKAFIEGYYIGSGTMDHVLLNQGISTCPDVTDSVDVDLIQPVTNSLMSTCKTLMKTDGSIIGRFADISGLYYVVVRSRNGIQSWSSVPVQIDTVGSFYDFTFNSSATYGNNLKEVETDTWAFYSGDINQDENVDLLDQNLLETDVANFEYGYRFADINGDGNVDLLDNPILETNINAFIFSSHP